MSAWDLIQWANAVVARDEETERRLTVPQEPWPADGTLPVAAHFLQLVRSDGKREIKWTGTWRGLTVECLTVGVDVPVRVKPTFEMLGDEPSISLRLVCDEGYTRAHAVWRVDAVWM